MHRNLLFAPLLFAAVPACAPMQGDFPSLERRDVELRDRAPPESVPVTVSPLSPVFADRLTTALGNATKGHDNFLSAVPAAEQAVAAARGTPPGGENWSVAQTLLSDLETRRSNVVAAQSDIDLLLIAQKQVEADDPGATGSADIAAAAQAVAQMLAAEVQIIEGLRLD